MPPDVREAKEICCLIIEKSEGMTGSEDKIFAAEEVDNKAKSEEEESNLPKEHGLFGDTPAVNAADEIETIRDSGNGNTDGSLGRHKAAATASSISPRLHVSLKTFIFGINNWCMYWNAVSHFI